MVSPSARREGVPTPEKPTSSRTLTISFGKTQPSQLQSDECPLSPSIAGEGETSEHDPVKIIAENKMQYQETLFKQTQTTVAAAEPPRTPGYERTVAPIDDDVSSQTSCLHTRGAPDVDETAEAPPIPDAEVVNAPSEDHASSATCSLQRIETAEVDKSAETPTIPGYGSPIPCTRGAGKPVEGHPLPQRSSAQRRETPGTGEPVETLPTSVATESAKSRPGKRKSGDNGATNSKRKTKALKAAGIAASISTLVRLGGILFDATSFETWHKDLWLLNPDRAQLTFSGFVIQQRVYTESLLRTGFLAQVIHSWCLTAHENRLSPQDRSARARGNRWQQAMRRTNNRLRKPGLLFLQITTQLAHRLGVDAYKFCAALAGECNAFYQLPFSGVNTKASTLTTCVLQLG